MEHLLTATYSLGGIVAAFFHLPQLRRLWTDPQSGKGIAGASWCGWFVISCNSVAYAILVNGDPALIWMNVLNLCCQACMLACMFRAARLRRRSEPAAASAPSVTVRLLPRPQPTPAQQALVRLRAA
ncbi:MAG TPA: hypothetical protein VED40_04985 [Azospirillaceae bacterium]|nr:hypothetical protein [Azospirillaceae bacterium]